MKRIGIDGRGLQGKRSGIGRYVYELCKSLDEIIRDSIFFVYSSKPIELPVLSERWILRCSDSIIDQYIMPTAWLKFRCGEFCRNDQLDVFWGTHSFLPILPKPVKTILTIHDLNFILAPQTMPFTNLYAHRLFFRKDLMRADSIVCNSEGTATRLKLFFGVDANAIVRPGVNDFFKTVDKIKIYSILQKHNIRPPYILTVASLEPRKNLPALIKAFLSLKKRGDLLDYKLVLIGGGGWRNKSLLKTIKGQKDIISLGYLEDTDIRALYAGADIFILPSLYEGFGMPILEARACGSKTIIATDIPELREAGGKETIYINPTVDGIIEGLIYANSFKKEIRETIELNYRTWNESAKILASLLTDDDNTSDFMSNASK